MILLFQTRLRLKKLITKLLPRASSYIKLLHARWDPTPSAVAPAGVVFMGGFYAGGMKKARSVAASFWSVELTFVLFSGVCDYFKFRVSRIVKKISVWSVKPTTRKAPGP